MTAQAITAQLFAHLSTHPEPRVRKQVEGLLMASAHLSPWAIVYPTLVDVNACEGEPPEELQHLIGCLVYCSYCWKYGAFPWFTSIVAALLKSMLVLSEDVWVSFSELTAIMPGFY
jgi:PI-3-kinase-related kinase SMG-1